MQCKYLFSQTTVIGGGTTLLQNATPAVGQPQTQAPFVPDPSSAAPGGAECCVHPLSFPANNILALAVTASLLMISLALVSFTNQQAPILIVFPIEFKFTTCQFLRRFQALCVKYTQQLQGHFIIMAIYVPTFQWSVMLYTYCMGERGFRYGKKKEGTEPNYGQNQKICRKSTDNVKNVPLFLTQSHISAQTTYVQEKTTLSAGSLEPQCQNTASAANQLQTKGKKKQQNQQPSRQKPKKQNQKDRQKGSVSWHKCARVQNFLKPVRLVFAKLHRIFRKILHHSKIKCSK